MAPALPLEKRDLGAFCQKLSEESIPIAGVPERGRWDRGPTRIAHNRGP